MGVAVFNIELQRNADYVRQWVLKDSHGAPLDLTGAAFQLDVKAAAGAPDPPIGSATFTMIDAANGVLEIALRGDHFAALPGGYERVVLAYDCIATQDGDDLPIARGAIILLPGVS